MSSCATSSAERSSVASLFLTARPAAFRFPGSHQTLLSTFMYTTRKSPNGLAIQSKLSELIRLQFQRTFTTFIIGFWKNGKIQGRIVERWFALQINCSNGIEKVRMSDSFAMVAEPAHEESLRVKERSRPSTIR